MLSPSSLVVGGHYVFVLAQASYGCVNAPQGLLLWPEAFEINPFDLKNLRELSCFEGRPLTGSVHVIILKGYDIVRFREDILPGIKEMRPARRR